MSYGGIVVRISFEYKKRVVFQIILQQMTSLFIILFMFIRNSSSKNGRRVNFDFQVDFPGKIPIRS